ncbi:hypothetical protein EMIT0P294_20342 [Pseudomonas sp. IT-P294]
MASGLTKIDEFHFFDNDYRDLASRIRRIQLNDSDDSLWPISDYGHRLYWVVFCPVMYANHSSQI